MIRRAKRSAEIRTPDRRKHAYTPKPHFEVTAALEKAGLDPEAVYRLRRWDERSIDLVALGYALAALIFEGWQIGERGAAPILCQTRTYPRVGETPEAYAERRRSDLRQAALVTARTTGLCVVFDRPPDAFYRILEIHRSEIARLSADPLYWIQKNPTLRKYLTRAEIGALATFVGSHNRYQAAIGNSAFTFAAGSGVPMTEEAIEAIEADYKKLCREIQRKAGPKAVSRCQDLATCRHSNDWYILQAAAHAIDPTLPALPHVDDFEDVSHTAANPAGAA